MHRGSRLVATLAAVVTVPAVLVLPVVTMPSPRIEPVTPAVTQLALAGIDASALRTSSAPVDDEAGHAHLDHQPAQATDGPAGPTPAAPVAKAAVAKEPVAKAPVAVAVAVAVVAPLAPAVVTAATATAPFTLVGVDWAGATPTGTAVQVRVRENGVWSAWSTLAVANGHGPDQDSAEATDAVVRSGSEPLLAAPGSDGVQVRIDTAGGVVPRDAKVTLIDPRTGAADATITPTPVSTAQAAGDPLRPAIITRAQWGADESMRSHGPVYTGPIQAGFLHHTASTSNYTPAQSAAQVRALYAWYTQGLKYSDIAYNFLVDRYGRLYEGRAGGIDKNVLGGHTAGFNQNTFAVSAIGNFDSYKPTTDETKAITTSVARLMAWKLALNHRDPNGSATLLSNSGAGTSRYSVGRRAVIPTIAGHRDIGSTACPGRNLETILPAVRKLAATYQGTQLLTPSVSPAVTPYGAKGTVLSTRSTTPVSWKLEVFSVCQSAAVRVLTGKVAKAGTVKVVWDQKRADGTAALPGTYRLVLSARNGSAVAYPLDVPVVVAETATSPAGPCAQLSRIADTERYAASVRIGRLTAPSARVVVIAPGADDATPEALVAAPLAALKGAPRLLTAAAALPAVVEKDIVARRTTTAYVVGTAAQIVPAVEARLKALGVTTVVRLAGADRAATAAAVADAMGVKGKAVAVSFDSPAGLDVAAAAAADAALARRPLVVVSANAVPPATAAVLTRLVVVATTVAGPAAAVSDAVVAALPGGSRVSGADDAATTVALADVLAASAKSVTVIPPGSSLARVLAAGSGRPLLLSTSTGDPVTSWLAARTAVAHVLVIATPGQLPDTAARALVAAIATRRATPAAPVAPAPPATPAPPTTTPPTPTPPPPPPPPAPTAKPGALPTSFSFAGSGFGHGVGMSQYGARGMALEGASGTQIVQHYYTGTTVDAVRDDQDLRVNLLHGVTTVVLRGEALAAGGGGVEVTVSGGRPVLGKASDVFTVVVATGKVTVTRTSAGRTTAVGTGAGAVVRWAGTRAPGTAGTAATVVNVASSVTGLATRGHRYRYGFIDIATTSATPARGEVVNQLRIHDEYLLGIAEVSSSWPAAALQAQVLAARSFALARYGVGKVRSACRCHVDDGDGPYVDQAFAGWAKESEPSGKNWQAAVSSTWASATTGMTVRSAGKPIAAFYFAASGGRTQASQDVWVAALPFAASVDDHWSMDKSVPWSAWLPRVKTQAQVAKAFGLADVARIDLGDRFASGAIRTARAWSSTGSVATVRGDVLRSRLGLPSTWVSKVTGS